MADKEVSISDKAESPQTQAGGGSDAFDSYRTERPLPPSPPGPKADMAPGGSTDSGQSGTIDLTPIATPGWNPGSYADKSPPQTDSTNPSDSGPAQEQQERNNSQKTVSDQTSEHEDGHRRDITPMAGEVLGKAQDAVDKQSKDGPTWNWKSTEGDGLSPEQKNALPKLVEATRDGKLGAALTISRVLSDAGYKSIMTASIATLEKQVQEVGMEKQAPGEIKAGDVLFFSRNDGSNSRGVGIAGEVDPATGKRMMYSMDGGNGDHKLSKRAIPDDTRIKNLTAYRPQGCLE
jgi:hypothetical protein